MTTQRAGTSNTPAGYESGYDATENRGENMIARVWHGFTTPEHADAYESHLKPELLPGLSRKKGFRGSHLLRRTVGSEVEFITIILWDSLDDVRAIAGHDYEKAVIPEDRLPLLSRYETRAAHYEVVSTNERPSSVLTKSPGL